MSSNFGYLYKLIPSTLFVCLEIFSTYSLFNKIYLKIVCIVSLDTSTKGKNSYIYFPCFSHNGLRNAIKLALDGEKGVKIFTSILIPLVKSFFLTICKEFSAVDVN